VGGLVGLRYLAAEGEHHGDGVFGGGNGVAERGVHHQHAAFGGGGDVDVVYAYSGAGGYFKRAFGGLKYFLGKSGGRADNDAVKPRQEGNKFFRLHAGFYHYFNTAVLKNFFTYLICLVGD